MAPGEWTILGSFSIVFHQNLKQVSVIVVKYRNQYDHICTNLVEGYANMKHVQIIQVFSEKTFSPMEVSPHPLVIFL